MLKALALRRRMPAWLMLRHVLVCFVRDLPPGERRWVIRRARATA
jgi:hypothetical protein